MPRKSGFKHSKETIQKIINHPNNIRTRFKKGHKPKSGLKKGNQMWKLRKKTPEYLKKLSNATKEWHKTNENSFKGKHHIEKTKQLLRRKSVLYMKKHRGYQKPNVGKDETQILNEIENFIGMKIERQYPILGYWVDGYLKRDNIVFEIDERPKIKEKDIGRENLIKQELNCTFIRIPTY